MLCPLQMLSLKDPVVDEMGFVYEKEAVFQWLSNQPGGGRFPVRAPIAGKALRYTIVSTAFARHRSHDWSRQA